MNAPVTPHKLIKGATGDWCREAGPACYEGLV
jgi:hypothetical protein